MSTSSARSILVRLRVEMGQAKKAFADLGGYVDAGKRKLTEFDKSLQKNQQQWDQVGTSMVRTGAALLATAAFAGRAAVQWESAFTGVRKTVNGTQQDFAKLETGLRGLATTMPESHQEIAAVAEAAGQLGVATGDIVDFTRVMVMLGDTTNLSSEEAATSIAQLMNIMGTAPQDVDRLGAALVGLGNNGASTEKQILEMAQRIAGAGRIVGMSEANVLALANAVASTGTEAELGGTAISQVLIKIQSAISTNSLDLMTWANTAKMSAKDFADAWAKDPTTAFTAFEKGLNEQGAKAFQTLDKLGIDGQRTTMVLLNLAGANKMLGESFRDGNKFWAQNQALVKEAEQRYDTTAAKIEIAWNQIKDAAIDAGAGLLPVLNGMSNAVGVLTAAFDLLPDGLQGTLGILAGSSGALLLAAGGFVKLARSVSETRAALVALELSGAGSSAMLAGLGRRALKVAGILAAVSAAANIISKSDVTGVSQFTESILDLDKGGSKALTNLNKLVDIKFSANGLDALVGQLDKFDDFGQRGLDSFKSLFGLGQFDSVSGTVASIDNALANLVSQGRAEDAARGFDQFAAAAQRQGQSLEWVKKQLPEYSAAQAQAKREAAESKDAFNELAGGSEFLAQRLESLDPDSKKAADMLAELEGNARDAAMSFFDFDEALKLPSLDSFISEMEKAVEASAKWGENMIKAAQMGVDEGLIQKFQEAGPAGAQMLDQLVNGSQEQVDRLNTLFGQLGDSYAELVAHFGAPLIAQFKTAGAPGAIKTATEVAKKYGLAQGDVTAILTALNYAEPEINAVLEALGLVQRTNPKPKITVNPGNSQSIIGAIISALSKVKDKTVTVTTKYTQVGNSPYKYSGIGATKAAGGSVTGPGSSTSDSIIARLSNGEHVWTAQEVRAAGGQGAVYAMRAQIRSGKRPKFADGGAASDAWDSSFRSAAASFSMPQRTVQSIVTRSAPVVLPPLEATLVSDRVRMDKDGNLRLIDQRVQLGIRRENRYRNGRG